MIHQSDRKCVRPYESWTRKLSAKVCEHCVWTQFLGPVWLLARFHLEMPHTLCILHSLHNMKSIWSFHIAERILYIGADKILLRKFFRVRNQCGEHHSESNLLCCWTRHSKEQRERAKNLSCTWKRSAVLDRCEADANGRFERSLKTELSSRTASRFCFVFADFVSLFLWFSYKINWFRFKRTVSAIIDRLSTNCVLHSLVIAICSQASLCIIGLLVASEHTDNK